MKTIHIAVALIGIGAAIEAICAGEVQLAALCGFVVAVCGFEILFGEILP